MEERRVCVFVCVCAECVWSVGVCRCECECTGAKFSTAGRCAGWRGVSLPSCVSRLLMVLCGLGGPVLDGALRLR